jgi:hypothetical protein
VQNVLKCGGDVDGHKKEGNIEISKNLQVATAAVDSLGLCLFVAFAVLDDARGVPCMAKLVSGLIGKDYSVDELVGMGVNCLKDELDFNKRAGFTDADDQLPRFFQTELLPPHNVGWDYSAEELQAQGLDFQPAVRGPCAPGRRSRQCTALPARAGRRPGGHPVTLRGPWPMTRHLGAHASFRLNAP